MLYAHAAPRKERQTARTSPSSCGTGRIWSVPITMNVPLTPQLEELARKKVDSGRYTSASEVVREALRLLDAYEAVRTGALARLRADVSAGWKDVEEGRVSDFDPEVAKRRRERLASQKRKR